MYDLRQRQDKESHCTPGSNVAGAFPSDMESNQRKYCEHEALQQNLYTVSVCEDALLFGFGRPLHDVLFNRLHPQGDGGQTVGYQVDPQQLHGQKRGFSPE